MLGGAVVSTATLVNAGPPRARSRREVGEWLTFAAFVAPNLLLLAIFAREAVQYELVPLVAMTAVAGYFVSRRHRPHDEERPIELKLSSPISLSKVLSFGGLFLLIQVFGTAAARWMGSSGLLVVSAVGGMVSSASTTAAAANLVAHGKTSPLEAGMATVITSIVSTLMNLPILRRQQAARPVYGEIVLATVLQVVVGLVATVGQGWLSMHWHRLG